MSEFFKKSFEQYPAPKEEKSKEIIGWQEKEY